MNVCEKQKQTHGYKKQSYGWKKGAWAGKGQIRGLRWTDINYYRWNR